MIEGTMVVPGVDRGHQDTPVMRVRDATGIDLVRLPHGLLGVTVNGIQDGEGVSRATIMIPTTSLTSHPRPSPLQSHQRQRIPMLILLNPKSGLYSRKMREGTTHDLN